jgi:hypothetical protein
MSKKTLAEIAKQMAGIDIAILSTHTEGGENRERPMSNNGDVTYDGTSCYFTHEEARAVSDIAPLAMQSLSAANELPEKPWMSADLGDWSALISFEPLHSFIADPERFAPQMIEWIDTSAADVNGFVSSDLKQRFLETLGALGFPIIAADMVSSLAATTGCALLGRPNQ